jgi:hypothetical protein
VRQRQHHLPVRQPRHAGHRSLPPGRRRRRAQCRRQRLAADWAEMSGMAMGEEHGCRRREPAAAALVADARRGKRSHIDRTAGMGGSIGHI